MDNIGNNRNHNLIQQPPATIVAALLAITTAAATTPFHNELISNMGISQNPIQTVRRSCGIHITTVMVIRFLQFNKVLEYTICYNIENSILLLHLFFRNSIHYYY